ncbi:MAG: V-type ATP synthase subunit F [Eubacteriaceae bacterium]|jgi:V/A-type H+-transporting ATPase subunit F|nr:V-type ATP synthase subunit F [Eubacteriaceae bacterium]
MHKVAVVGDRDSVLCFRAFGFSVFAASEDDAEQTRKLIDALAKDEYGIIFVTEQIAQTVNETIDRYNESLVPAIILIPSNKGSLGIGMARIRSNVEKAVGINILD